MDSAPVGKNPVELNTQRLILRAATLTMATNELAYYRDNAERNAFADAIGAEVFDWPPLYNDAATCSYFVEKLSEKPESVGWWAWYILLRRPQSTPLIIGSIGFHGPPNAEGYVEIGYSVLEPFQRQGITPEAVTALMGWAFGHADVTNLVISTLDQPEFVPSSKVAQKLGFRYTGKCDSDEGVLLVYELSRHDYNSGGARAS